MADQVARLPRRRAGSAPQRPAPQPPPPRHPAPAGAPRWARFWSFGLAIAGLLVSAYLTVEHYTASTTLACPGVGVIDCAKVTTSAQSSFLGVPVALLGLLFFVAMVAVTLPAVWRFTGLLGSLVRYSRLGLTVLGVIFVIYLIYAELFILDAICLWCTAVHVLTLALFAVIALGSVGDSSTED